MNCLQCGTANPEGSRFCGRCGAALPARSRPVALPLVGGMNRESVGEAAGALVGVLASILSAVGLGMAADFLVKYVAARVGGCACGCLILLGLLVCVMAAWIFQAVQYR